VSHNRLVIGGCGDIGRRVAKRLQQDSKLSYEVSALVNTPLSADLCRQGGMHVAALDLDKALQLPTTLNDADLIYLVPPSKIGFVDQRSTHFISAMLDQNLVPKKVVLISTTAVYGDCNGNWINEQTTTQPQTERGRRRLNGEQQWSRWASDNVVSLTVLRVAGIYANNRIPRDRIKKGSPVVIERDCGFTNRIHADDLVQVIIAALDQGCGLEILNVSDGVPGTITEFLVEASKIIGLPALPQISLAEAEQQLSKTMLSYLQESRRIDNTKMLNQLKVTLSHPDFRSGLRH
jgi:nucleoside-diphosphate-sugar epimerase